MGVSAKVTNAQQVRQPLNRYRRRYSHAVAGALYLEGLRIIRIANRLVPVDTGRLRATAYVEPPMPAGMGRVTVTLGYGTDYALAVHENLEARHEVGQARYLADAVAQRIPNMGRSMASTVKRLAKEGRGFGVVGAAAIATAPNDPGAEWQRRKRESRNRRRKGGK